MNKQVSAMNQQKVTSASIEGHYLSFSNGSRVQVAHITSITPINNSDVVSAGAKMVAGIVFVIGGGLIAALLGQVNGWLGFLGFILGGYGLYKLIYDALMKNVAHGVHIVCSSAENWVVAQASEEIAAEYCKDLQEKIAKQIEIPRESAASAKPATVADELIKLSSLLQQGVISQIEFDTLKAKALGLAS